MAIQEARESVPEDERSHPKVGVVIVKDGRVLAKAHRGEVPAAHAEFVALEEKAKDLALAGATVYTTLEPCTARNHPKIPCAERLVERRVSRVVIGMLDPNPDIRGLGDQLLSEANIETQLFPRDLRAQVEEMNREFIRSQGPTRGRRSLHSTSAAPRLRLEYDPVKWSRCREFVMAEPMSQATATLLDTTCHRVGDGSGGPEQCFVCPRAPL
jgi:pyrimidine deaminase RibD-like protein